MRFEERDLKPYGQPVDAKVLEQGKVYFSVQFADDDMLIPIMEAWVFAGNNLNPEDTGNQLYFQDVDSYLQGIRYSTATDENATFQVGEENANHFFEYEYALEELLKCSLRRRKGQSKSNKIEKASIHVDFNNCDREGRVRLNTIGAIQSLNLSGIVLWNGLEVELECGDFFPIRGIVEYSETEHIWVARFDLSDLRDRSDG